MASVRVAVGTQCEEEEEEALLQELQHGARGRPREREGLQPRGVAQLALIGHEREGLQPRGVAQLALIDPWLRPVRACAAANRLMAVLTGELSEAEGTYRGEFRDNLIDEARKVVAVLCKDVHEPRRSTIRSGLFGQDACVLHEGCGV